jgi:hypothetical protein
MLFTVDDLVRDGFGLALISCLVAEVASEIIGIALYYYRYSTWKGKTIHLEDLVVKEKNAVPELCFVFRNYQTR